MLLDSLVIGSTVESALYSLVNDCYYLPTNTYSPLFYKKLKHRLFLSPRRDYSWSRIGIILSLTGKLLSYENIGNVRIRDKQISIASSLGSVKYDFEKCIIFDPTGINLENKILKQAPNKYFVYDDFELSNLGAKHKFIKSKEQAGTFAREIHYYTSSRVDGANYVTDCVAESHLTENQLSSVEYSDSMVRFAVERHLTSIGIHGNMEGVYKSGKPKYRKPKVIHKRRIITEKDCNVYQDSEKVKFLNLSIEEILDAPSPTGS